MLDARVHEFLLYISRCVLAFSGCHNAHAAAAMDMSEGAILTAFFLSNVSLTQI